jgi:hypothetical protein
VWKGGNGGYNLLISMFDREENYQVALLKYQIWIQAPVLWN